MGTTRLLPAVLLAGFAIPLCAQQRRPETDSVFAGLRAGNVLAFRDAREIQCGRAYGSN